jgi:DNA-binding response OmpR family regulator
MKDGKKYILVADDESEIREVLTLLLSGEGYAVVCAEDGQTAAELASPEIDLYILDVNMPRASGFSAGADIRRRFDTPIMFLTAYSGESDKVMGFSVGADDYLVKPFSNAELLMRVKAILRRRVEPPAPATEPLPNNRLVLGDLILDLSSQTVLRGEEAIALTYTEFRILELLLTHRKRIFSPDHIYQSVWNDNAVGDAAIMVHIKNLRKKLGDDSRNPTYIKTAWGRGYYVD